MLTETNVAMVGISDVEEISDDAALETLGLGPSALQGLQRLVIRRARRLVHRQSSRTRSLTWANWLQYCTWGIHELKEQNSRQ